jgi:ribosomal protein S30
MKFALIAMGLLISLALPEVGFAAPAREQTDWYSRGIIRQQTIKLSARKKKQQYLRRKKRRAHTVRHRASTKPASVVKN